jgi:hypothetical protein
MLCKPYADTERNKLVALERKKKLSETKYVIAAFQIFVNQKNKQSP